jgi:hypothetical protein
MSVKGAAALHRLQFAAVAKFTSPHSVHFQELDILFFSELKRDYRDRKSSRSSLCANIVQAFDHLID